MAEPTLVFVYNVDASPLALLRDLHRALTTGSTDCHLCDVTFGRLLKDRSWARFVAGLPVPAEFRLRSTFLRRHPELRRHAFPAVFLARPGEAPRELIGAAEIEAVPDLAGLRDLVGARVAALGRADAAGIAPGERRERAMSDSKTHERVRDVYTRVATQGTAGGNVTEHARSIGYSEEELASSPEGANVGAGCGNPSAIDSLRPGETVVDLGSGAGMDVFLAARRVGPGGRAIGVDMTDAMLEKARKNAATAGLANVEFRKGNIEALPLEDESVDVILSNCVISLSPDKPRVYREAHRVLRPGGRVMVSDLVLRTPVPTAVIEAADALLGFGRGVELRDDYLALIRDVGFEDVHVRSEAPFGGSLIDDERAGKLAEVLDLTPAEVRRHADALVSIHVYASRPA